MTKANFDLTSLIVCDDVRAEVGGKQSANGIYDGEMLVESFPVLLPKLCFRAALVTHKLIPKKVKILVESPNEKLLEFEGDITKPSTGNSQDRFTFVFAAVPAMLQHAGTYTIKLGVDGPLKKVGEFIVRMPKTKAEKAKITAAKT